MYDICHYCPRNNVEYSICSKVTYSHYFSMEGTIKRLTDRGYGFIDDGSGQDVFFHASELQGLEYNDLNEGDKVTFETQDSPKGPQAVGVKKA